MELLHFEEIDDMELIKLVELNSCIYNKKMREFKTVDKKEVWAQIGAALTNRKTGNQAQKRWDSLRAMWSRQHKQYYEQERSGSGASRDTQEFQYYGEMSFLVPHYSSRTKSNMKRSTSCMFNNGSSGSQFVINKPSPIVTDNPCIVIQDTADFDTAQSDDTYTYESVSLSNDDGLLSISQQSSHDKNEMHNFDTEDRIPFSSMAQAVLNTVSSKQALCNKTGRKKEYKQKENSNVKIPEPDEFCKKKKVDVDNYMRLGAQSLEKVAQSVEHVISQKTKQKVDIFDSDNVDKDIHDMLKCAYVGLKQVRFDMRFNCVLDILKVINKYKEQEIQNNN